MEEERAKLKPFSVDTLIEVALGLCFGTFTKIKLQRV